MTFGPLGSEPPPADGLLYDAELRSRVRSAAKALVEDLSQAQLLTGAWSDRALNDVLVESAMGRCLRRLSQTGCWGQANQLPSSELWNIAGQWLEVGSLQLHARAKPHGYAGDYEILTRICQRSCCDHPLGAAFDRYFLSQAAPEAVRARTEQIAAALVADCLKSGQDPYEVVSVGSGPALDIARAVSLLPSGRRQSLRIRLLDMDPHALDAARTTLEPLLPPQGQSEQSTPRVAYLRTNLFRLPQRSDGEESLGRPHFLVCSGLFDYLKDEAAAPMLDLFWRRLAPGGLMLVGNFAPHNPTRAYMEWVGNWYLTYRTPQELEQLARAAGIPRQCFTVGCERTGNDLFLIPRSGRYSI